MGKAKRRTAPNAWTSRVWSQLWRVLKVVGPVAVAGLIVTLLMAGFAFRNRLFDCERTVTECERTVTDRERTVTNLNTEKSVLRIENAELTATNSHLQRENTESTDKISGLWQENTKLRTELDKADKERSHLEKELEKALPNTKVGRPPSSEPLPRQVGKAVPASVRRFPADLRYVGSGAMGDIGDCEIGIGTFTYKTAGKGPHEYEWKYENDGRTLNPRAARFGGVVWLSPSGAFGTAPNGGYDLRGFRGIEWEARAIGDPVKVEFFIGGIDRVWKKSGDGRWQFVGAPYPDTMPRTSLGIRKLTNEWRTFGVFLEDQPESNFGRVVGGFGWIANWGNNGVEPDESGMGSNKVKKFTFELRNVFYVKEIE